MENNARERRGDDDNNANFGGDDDFTTLDISPDYGDTGSGDYDNEFRAAANSGENGGLHENSQNRNNRGVLRSVSNPAGDGRVNTGFHSDLEDGDSPDGNAREMYEMNRLGRSEGTYRRRGSGDLGDSGHRWAGDTLRHRRAKSQRLNGFDYYRHRHRRQSSVGFEPDPDYTTDDEPTLTPGDIARTRQFLATIKVRRKSRKRGSSRGSGKEGEGKVVDDGGEGGGAEGDGNDGDNVSFEEDVGLPSARAKMKGLAERVLMARQLDSAADVAQEYKYTRRDTFWEVRYPTRADRRGYVFKRSAKVLYDFIEAFNYNISFWSQHFKEIEGQCGIATTSYFRFTRWLIKINFLVFLIFFLFLYVPQFITWAHPSKNVFIETKPFSTSDKSLKESLACSTSYNNYVRNISDYSGIPVVLDVFKGTGLLEDTSIFYGRYSNLSITIRSFSNGTGSEEVSTDYNMSLVYMLVMIFSFLLIFIMIVKTSSMSVRETIMDLDNHAIPSYSNAVFSGWDYCINSEKMAFYKQKIIFHGFQAKLEELEIKRQQKLRTRKEKLVLFGKRAFINVVVFCILGGCFTAIVFTTNFLLEKQEEDLGEIESLAVEFMPSIVITVFNLIVPLIFMFLTDKEEYSPDRSTSLVIVRAVFLRISLVGVLLFSIYYRVFHKKDRNEYFCPEEGVVDSMSTTCCGNPLWKTSTVTSGKEKGSVKCWETYVGQQMYKLSVADFLNTCVLYLGWCCCRKLVYSKFKDNIWFVSKLGLQPFDLPLEVLDIIYTQTLCWVGMLFAPLLPAFCLIQVFIYFFVKKFILLKTSEPPKISYQATRSYSFFQVVLLVTFTLICILLGYMIGNIQPSKGCGPFRVYGTPDHVMFNAITNEVSTWPALPKGIFYYFGTVAFFIPAFLILSMAIYYYWTVSQGYKRLQQLLQHQLKSESHDKQYLLARVDEIIKKGELNLHGDMFGSETS